MSLKQTLKNHIAQNRQVSYDEMKDFVEKLAKKYRWETALRRLREIPDIEPILQNGSISGWAWTSEPIKWASYFVDGKLISRTPIY